MALLGASPERDVAVIVVETIRLPRSLTAMLAGASLGIAGLQMQTLFRNPLADPFALGISSGASLGVALVVLGAGYGPATAFGTSMGLRGDALVAAAAIVGAALVLGLVLVVSRTDCESDHGADPRPDVRLRRVGRRHRARRREPARAAAAVGAVGIRIVLRRDLGAARGSSDRLTFAGHPDRVGDDEAAQRAAARRELRPIDGPGVSGARGC